MTYLSSWEEFEKGAERLYLHDPINVCFFTVISYVYFTVIIICSPCYIVFNMVYIF